MKQQKEKPEEEEPSQVSDILFHWIKNLEIILLILCSACLGAMWVESRANKEKQKQQQTGGERLTLIIGTMHKAVNEQQKEEEHGSIR